MAADFQLSTQVSGDILRGEQSSLIFIPLGTHSLGLFS